jgi:hypothetical protein
MDYCRLKLSQEREARKQVIGHAFRAIGVIGITPCPGAKRGHVGEVSEVKNRLRGVRLAEGEHCFGRSRIGQVAVCA